MLNWIIYTYKKRNRWLDPIIQDMIAEKTGFTPYKIKLLVASKENPKVNEFNSFEFMYKGSKYKLLDDTLTKYDY